MSKCKRCGSRVPKGLTQCPNCGSPVERRRKWPFVALISSSLVIIVCCVVCGLWLAGVFGGGQGEQPGGQGKELTARLHGNPPSFQVGTMIGHEERAVGA